LSCRKLLNFRTKRRQEVHRYDQNIFNEMTPMTIRHAIISTTMIILQFFLCTGLQAQNNKPAILAYYAGPPERLDSFDAAQMTHIIFCFGHLDSNLYALRSNRDTLVIQRMVAMKERNPELKVLLSLCGWCGCEPCSDAFSTKEGRKAFARSVKEITAYFNTDGIDLDWEYPSIPGYPGHKYSPSDKEAFTELLKELRSALGKKQIISVAAGGFQSFLDKAVDWDKVMRYVDYVNLMSYDLVSGFATTTGHHTALYSNPQQKESTDNAVQYLIKKGVKRKKIIIGAAFYARIWENVSSENNGLYQSGKFKMGTDFRNFPSTLSKDSGFVFHWDEVTQAPYAYHPERRLFATFDDKRSVSLKAQYVTKHKLGGIMFWQLGSDTYTNGLLQTINNTFSQQAK
jgi:chitinase